MFVVIQCEFFAFAYYEHVRFSLLILSYKSTKIKDTIFNRRFLKQHQYKTYVIDLHIFKLNIIMKKVEFLEFILIIFRIYTKCF